MPLSAVEFKGILCHALKLNRIDPDGLESLVMEYRTGIQLVPMEWLPTGESLNPEARYRYETLLRWVKNYRAETIDEQLYSAFSQVISPQLTPEDELADVHELIRSLYIERIARSLHEGSGYTALAAREWLIQVKTGIVADTPNKPREIDPAAVVIGTPQKIIDFEIERRLHFWLDFSSREWSSTDNAPLYNAWIH